MNCSHPGRPHTVVTPECGVQCSCPVHAHTVVTPECGVQCSCPVHPHTVVTRECGVRCSCPARPHTVVTRVQCPPRSGSPFRAGGDKQPAAVQTPRREASPPRCGCGAGRSWRGRGPAQSALLPFLLGLRPNVCAFNAAPRMKAPALPGASTVGTRARRPWAQGR